ncbi:multiprotein bridging factor type 1, putative [Perkinsus marinus ATCC 50983]|uniref:Multiprotein bridging factor type 1, putative n=1 Tax=Perkinsus marinus (strain ATCC 50983 / TXsc) TaxID=423536 RepID=C5KJW7_PERM5|nr:multiprotein bridging factor type 1, putative [Perkinsus marinus ATCC 50983]EER15225.1 multiprotein bridging factor type 1, putative [Perkinsus marinus ATCC 50983]|mmetsp:Transcript_9418/g.9261  ORF Transcript_9418/g.9261 Transcript_9418/m.9261 type:complete len:145 (+) Transcript_9418:50-484(+)|eukprot:XP_002783429.1 multiprotein bridging factor type 1, putative [Perkinsus marinus ATCC 50983]
MVRMAADVSQDWNPVVLNKGRPKNPASRTAVNDARRTGQDVEVTAKWRGGQNMSTKEGLPANAAKLDQDNAVYKHPHISTEFRHALQQARLAKKMSQADLAKAINEKPTVINEYESGKAIPNGAIISKLNRILGTRLPKAKAGN